MKKTLVFVLFCAAGFCAGYVVGVPFFKSALKASETPLRGDAERIEEQIGGFVSLASRDNEPKAAPKSVKTTGQKSAPPSNPAAGVKKLTLPEVQA